MIRTYRILIIGVLILTQLFAPLVHAHAGGAGLPGVMHVPGLEFLSAQGGVYAQDRGERLAPEAIIALSPGLKDVADLAVPSPEPQQGALPVAVVGCDTRPPGVPGCVFRNRAPYPDRVFPSASPRAPPA